MPGQHRNRLVVGAVASSVAVVGSTVVAAPASAEPGPTSYAMTALGYGTQIVGGDVGANSGQTALQVLACTNKAGVDKTNAQAYQSVPGVGVVRGASTRVWTQRIGTTVSSFGRHTIESLTINQPGVGVLLIEGLQSTARTWHDSSGYHRSGNVVVGDLTFTPTGGQTQSLPDPTVAQPVTVPGVATISVGSRTGSADAAGARSYVAALNVQRLTTGTNSRIARATATIAGGVRGGLFSGQSSGSRASGLADNTRSGPTPLIVMPCQGTDGEFQQRSVASVDLGNGVVLSGLSAAQGADQDRISAQGYQTGRVNSLAINGDDLVVRDVRGRASVLLESGVRTRSVRGTQVGRVTSNGETRTFPDSGVLTIPGVARLERRLVNERAAGIAVTALRVTLLDGSGAVINLGQARLDIRDSGR